MQARLVSRLVAAGDEIERLALGKTFGARSGASRLHSTGKASNRPTKNFARGACTSLWVTVTVEPSTLTTSTWASVVPMSFWMMRRALAADRGRVEPGMIEFQAARALEPAHEGGDERLVFGAKAIGERAGDGVLGALCGEAVERLVQIHHETMQAVGLAD